MREWYSKNHAAMVACHVERSMISSAVRSADENGLLKLRPGSKDFILAAQVAQIPLLVFSAGLGDVIEAILKLKVTGGEPLPPSTSVVANKMLWSSDSAAVRLVLALKICALFA